MEAEFFYQKEVQRWVDHIKTPWGRVDSIPLSSPPRKLYQENSDLRFFPFRQPIKSQIALTFPCFFCALGITKMIMKKCFTTSHVACHSAHVLPVLSCLYSNVFVILRIILLYSLPYFINLSTNRNSYLLNVVQYDNVIKCLVSWAVSWA